MGPQKNKASTFWKPFRQRLISHSFLRGLDSYNLYNFMDGIDGIAGIEALSALGIMAYLLMPVNAGISTIHILLAAAVYPFQNETWISNRDGRLLHIGDTAPAAEHGSPRSGGEHPRKRGAATAQGRVSLWSVSSLA